MPPPSRCAAREAPDHPILPRNTPPPLQDRTLHSQATGDEFVAALDGYITHWDGLDDAGQLAPAGHYKARGYMVGSNVSVKPVTAG